MSSPVKAVSNTVFLSLDWAFITLFSFIYSFVIWRTLTPFEYGIISTSVNLMMILGSISMLGMNTAVQKLISEYVEKRQRREIGSVVKMSMTIIFIMDAAICALLIANASYIASVLKVTEPVVWLIAAGTFVFSMMYITSNILIGFQDMKGFFKTNFLGNLSKLLLSTTFIFLGFSYFGPLLGVLIGFSLIPLMRLKVFRYPAAEKYEKKKVLFEYAMPAFISLLASLTFNNSHYIILTVIKNPEATGLFSLAMVIATLISLVPNIIAQAIFPIMSQLSVKKKKAKQSKLIGIAFRYSLFLAIPLSIFIVAFLKPLILFLKIKTEYLPAIQYLPLLSVGSILFGCAGIFSSALYAIGKTKVSRNIWVSSAVVFLLTSIPLTYMFSAYGIVYAFLITNALFFLASYIFLRKYLGFKTPVASISKILFASLMLLAVVYFGGARFESFIMKIFVAAIAFSLYIAALLMMRFFNGQDIFIIRNVTEKMPEKIKKLAEIPCKIIGKFCG